MLHVLFFILLLKISHLARHGGGVPAERLKMDRKRERRIERDGPARSAQPRSGPTVSGVKPPLGVWLHPSSGVEELAGPEGDC